MSIHAQSADGQIHEFPDGTDPGVVDRVMKQYAQSSQSPQQPLSYGQKWEQAATQADVRPPADTGNLLTDTVTQFPANLTNAQNHSYAMLRSGLHDLGQGDMSGLIGAGLGGLGFAAAPISAALAPAAKPVHGMISQPLEDLTGGAIPAPITDAAVMSLIPGLGITKGPFTVAKTAPVGMSRAAGDVLLRQLSTDDTLSGTGAARIRQGGPNAMLADAGPAAANLLDTAMQRSGPGATAARQAVEQRATQANQDLTSALDRTMGQPSGVETQQAAIRTGSAPARQAAYDAAYRRPIDYTTIEGRNIEQLMERVPPEAITQANKMMRAEGSASRQIKVNVNDNGTVSFEQMPDVRQLDYITRGLNEVAQGAEGQGAMRGTTAVGRIYGNLSSEIRNNLRQAVPEYDNALSVAADPIGRIRSTEFGSTLLDKAVTREQVADQVNRMSPAERRSAISGLRSQIDEIASNVKQMASDPNVDARQLRTVLQQLSSRAAREKVTALVGTGPMRGLASQISQAARALELRASTSVNSRTFGRTATAAQVSAQAEPGPLGLLMELHPVRAAQKFVQSITRMTPERRLAMEDRLYGQIADALTRTRGRDAERFLTQLRSEIMLRAGQRARDVNRAASAATGAGANTILQATKPILPPPTQMLQQAQPTPQEQQQRATPSQAAWNGSGGPLLQGEGGGRGRRAGDQINAEQQRRGAPIDTSPDYKNNGWAGPRAGVNPDGSTYDTRVLPRGSAAGRAEADRAEVRSRAAAAELAKPQPSIKTNREILQDWRLAAAKGEGATTDYSKYGGPNKPLSQMTSADLREYMRTRQQKPLDTETMVPDMAAIENTRRALAERQALAATGDLPKVARDTYSQSRAPDAVIEPAAIRAALLAKLASATSMRQKLEIAKLLAENEMSSSGPSNVRRAAR